MDLKQVFGNRYVISLDESWDAETPENRAEFLAKGELWWYYELRGKCGMVYPYSETQIAVILPTRAAHRLVKLMGKELTLLQHADLEMCYKTEARFAEALVRFIKPKSCRQLTEAQKSVLASRLATYRQREKEAALLPGAERRPLSEPGIVSGVVQNGTAYGHRPNAPRGAERRG